MPLRFSYGTLQQDDVQLATFGRRLHGRRDELVGYECALLAIDDPAVVAASGKTHHPIARRVAERARRLAGTVFEISDDELARADRYEVAAYRRVLAELASGARAWVYVDARDAA